MNLESCFLIFLFSRTYNVRIKNYVEEIYLRGKIEQNSFWIYNDGTLTLKYKFITSLILGLANVSRN